MRFRYQPALDGLRAVAVLSVIAYHADAGWARGGFLGVDAFFVLSGFLITTLLVMEYRDGRSIGLIAFWGRRARRLLPALLLMLLVVAAYGATHIPAIEMHQFRGDALASLAYVTNWRFIASGTSYFTASPSPVRHLWSLAIEEQFYLVWPLVVLACLRLTRGSLRALTVLSLGGIAASGVLMATFDRSGDVSRAYYGTDARAHSILVGALLAVALVSAKPREEPRTRWIAPAGWLGLGAMTWMLHDMSGESTTYYRGGSLVFALAIAAVIAALVQPGTSRLRSCFSLPPLVWVGRISYGLYLWHWPVDIFATEQRVGVGGAGLQAVRLGLTFAFAIGSYYLVEMPIRRGAISLRIVRPFAPVAVAATAAVILLTTTAAAPLPSYLGGGAQAFTFAPRVANPGAHTVRSNGLITKHGKGAVSTIQIYPCPEPTEAESSAAAEAVAASGPPPAPRAGGPLRVLVVGDSVACSMAYGLGPAGAPALDVDQAAVLGCGVVAGEIWDAQEPFAKFTGHCPTVVPQLEQQAIGDFHPELVLWISTWERFNLVQGGVVYRAGSEQWKQLLDRRLETGYRRLTAGGENLVVATIAAPSPAGQLLGERVTSPKFDWRFTEMNKELVAFAARHPSRVTLLDIAHFLCPKGPPCPAEVDGVNPRRIDGSHFDSAGAVWMSRWMLPQLLAAAPRVR